MKNIKTQYEDKEFDLLPFSEEYWTNNTTEIIELIKKHNFKHVLEIGCWLGFTTRHLAIAIPENGSVVAVDPWQTFNDGISKSLYTLAQNEFDIAYQQFLSNMIHKEVADKIYVIKKPSLEAVKQIDKPKDLVFIDGAHDEKSVYDDICAWFPRVRAGGVLCGDDWFCPGVEAAVKRFANENNLSYEVAPKKYQGDLSRLGKCHRQTFWHIIKPSIGNL